MTLRARFAIATGVTVALALVELGLVVALLRTHAALGTARQVQHDSVLLARELRDSSDELTRTARTYTVTGDPAHREAYWQILRVRDGAAPRPDGRTAALRTLLREAGITPDELARLQQAEDESNALVATEVAAFAAMEGRFLPAGGAPSRDARAYSRRAAPDPAYAARLMHDDAYAAEKARIMAPIAALEQAVAARTAATVTRLQARSTALMWAITALVALLVAGVLGAHALVQRPVLRAIGLVTRQLEGLAAGALQSGERLAIGGRDEIAALAAAVNAALDRLAALVDDVREEAAAVAGRADEMGTLLAELQGSLEEQEASTHSTNAAAREIAVTSSELRQSTRAMAGAAERTGEVVGAGAHGLVRLGETMSALLDANRQIVARLSLINDKAGEIDAMADVIRKVAEQTDLLSLNAAIEAEKAGALSSGFGVVARQIRRLADHSDAAVVDIGAVLRDVRAAIDAGVMELDQFSGRLAESAAEAGRIQRELGAMIREVQALLPRLEALDAAFRGQDEGVQRIREDVQALSARVQATADTLARAQRNRAAVEEAGARLRDLVGAAARD